MGRGLRAGIVFSSLVVTGLNTGLSSFRNYAGAATVSQTGTGGGPGLPGQTVTLGLTNTGDASNSVTTVGGNGGVLLNAFGIANGGNATSTDTRITPGREI
jgi:hypothetical protein